ncbi:putative quinol monooxygenase [Marinobacterium stanieri]|uniref:Quinol monooxygenase YgiN n=1 Tax=Marinobacterium stanieri TaxID=49186 RepID=A0A1N6QJ35_9GAMM|nr:antibiotic biosynthesis monooxygenase [Marinobacterium stanieri]SIQ16585.1 Quinol monooxygenase YgiN [Marinobacterium stanieri]
MSEVTLKGFILVAKDELTVVKHALGRHTQLTREEPGCIQFDVTQSQENPCRFEVFEVFKNKEAFEHHQARVQSSDWGRLTVNVERHYEVFE